MTRQNYIPCVDEIPVNVIIPVWDFCNHANNKDENDTEPSTTYRVDTASCICVAPRDFAKGEQINIFYGGRSNADFLVHNGFVYPENHHDVLKIKFGISNSDAYLLRLALLRKLKLPPSGEYLIKCDKKNPIHSSVLAFLRIFKMTEEQLHEWIEKEIDIVEDYLLGPVGSMEHNFEVQVLQYIQTRLNILLKAYPTTLEEDEKIIAERTLAPIRKLVILQRITEKRILHAASTYCSEKISELRLESIQITT